MPLVPRMSLVRRMSQALIAALALLVSAGTGHAQRPAAPEAPERRIAVTFDDVPGSATVAGSCDPAALTTLNQRLLDALDRQQVPATALVVGSRVCDAERALLLPALLERWRAAGHAVGNHTFSHRGLNGVSLEWYMADIERNQQYLPPSTVRWFRPPLLHTGDTRAKQEGLYAALAERGYRMAPVTVDNQEWVFADVYTRAKAAGDSATMSRVAAAYVPFMDSVLAFFERRSVIVLGREIPQVLLLHLNDLNADHFDALADMMRGRGYRFISLADAMEDPAYERPDPYVGPRGLSWLHRWGLGEGLQVVEEPREPAWLDALRRQ